MAGATQRVTRGSRCLFTDYLQSLRIFLVLGWQALSASCCASVVKWAPGTAYLAVLGLPGTTSTNASLGRCTRCKGERGENGYKCTTIHLRNRRHLAGVLLFCCCCPGALFDFGWTICVFFSLDSELAYLKNHVPVFHFYYCWGGALHTFTRAHL